MLLAYPRGRCALGEFFFLSFCSGILNNNGYFSCTNGLFPQWLCKGHVRNCPPPAVTDIERLKEKLCDQDAPVGQEQMLNTSFVITLLHCPSPCITGQKNSSQGSSLAIIGPIWGSSFYLCKFPLQTKNYNFHELLLPFRDVLLPRGQGQHVPVQIQLEEQVLSNQS